MLPSGARITAELGAEINKVEVMIRCEDGNISRTENFDEIRKRWVNKRLRRHSKSEHLRS